MNKEEYPEMLSEEESEEYEFKDFSDSNSYKKDYNKAVKYAKKIKGIVYTRIDAENNKTFCWRGKHFVNRFGYCVIKKEVRK